ncbi:MAG: tail fiber domain-containing protein, partial [Flavobacteriales bacterium]|nr:tail fiber domain-containing protein [Flavobacteriales bacterium]
MIRHDANQPIQWFTDSLQRMVLTNTDTNATVNGFDSLDLSGFLGVGHFNSIPGDRPLTFVHISDTGTFAAGYRPWMRAGLLVTDRSDAMYFGTKNDQGNDRRDAVINWSDNLEYAPQWGPDALRFIFTRAADSTNVASENDGLELMRMVPHIGGNEGFAGIGDFKSAAATPDERLDILDRTIRLRAFVDSIAYRNDSLLRVLVVDSTDGRVYWRPIAGMGDGCSSGWMLNGNDPVTAFDGNICPPQSIDRVGIGTDKPEAKLHVRKDTTNGLNTERAGFFHNVITASTGIGMDALAEGQGSQWNIGGRGIARNSGRSVGLWGIAEGDLPNTTNTGVRAEAFSSPTHNLGVSSWASGGTNATGVTATGIGGSDLSTGGSFMGSSSVTTTGVKASATSGSLFTYGVQGQGTGGGRAYGLWGSASAGQSLNYGVYGTATGPGWSTVYAGYFNGDVMAFGGTYQGSDAALKTGITDVVAADQPDVVAQLQLHTYHYDHEAHPALNMPQGEQLGLLADELEELLPGLVKQSVQPAVLDSVGNEVHPEVEFKAVNYTGLIPHLVLAIQQQQARIDELTELVQACCTADTKATDPN